MRYLYNKILHAQYLNVEEILRLKVLIISVFLVVLSGLIIPYASFSIVYSDLKTIFIVIYFLILVIEIVVLILQKAKLAMHLAIILLSAITAYVVIVGNSYYVYIVFYIVLVAIFFFQDIIVYTIYGSVVTTAGIFYVLRSIDHLLGVNSDDQNAAMILYIVVLVGFFLSLFAQLILSVTHYRKLSKEWIKMNKLLEKYQEFSLYYSSITMVRKDGKLPYHDEGFVDSIKEICQFTNEFFVENGVDILSSVELYFDLHNKSLLEILEDEKYTSIEKRKAMQLNKYSINKREDMSSMLLNLCTMFKDTDEYDTLRYQYNIDAFTKEVYRGYFVVALLYIFLRNTPTQFDELGNLTLGLNHNQINELFLSKVSNDFLTKNQVNFYIENEELFREYLKNV